MLETLPAILIVGTVLGFLTGLGIGGGSLLILWLTMVLNMDAPMARGINLLFFLPAALISCCFRWKQGKLPWHAILPAAAAGCTAAALFSWISTWIDVALARKLFGLVLIVTALREIFWRPRP